MKPDEQRMRDVLVDTIRLLCRTGVEYSRRLRVQGLLGITVDDERVFLISVDDCIARNCADVDDNSCEFADEVNTASHSHATSDAVHACASSGDHNISEDLRADCTKQSQFDPVVQFPKHISLNESAHNNILAAVALSEISSVVAAGAKNLPSSQLSSQDVQLHGNIPISVMAEACREAEYNGHAMSNTEVSRALDSVEQNASVKLPPASEPNEVVSDDQNELPTSVKMETDVGVTNRTENDAFLQQVGETNSSTALYTMSQQNQCVMSLNLDDIDSSSADTNDSERTSESEELPDHLSVAPRLDLVSSLQFNPHGLVGDASRKWPVGSIKLCGSDGGGSDAVAIQPAMLTGVVANAGGSGSHASTYYQQQILAAAAAAAHNRAARAAATSIKYTASTTESLGSMPPLLPIAVGLKPPQTSTSSSYSSQRRLPRRPRESEDKRFRCPFCELAYYHKKHLKYHLTKKHGF